MDGPLPQCASSEALPISDASSPGSSPELYAISRDARGRGDGCFAPILLPERGPKREWAPEQVNGSAGSAPCGRVQQRSSTSSYSSPSSIVHTSSPCKRGTSPLVSRLLKRMRAPVPSPRVPVRVLTALSFADADALLAARVEKGEVSETELISLLHPRTRDTLHIVDCAHIRNATLRRCIETCAPNLVSIDFSHSTQVNNSVVSRVLLQPHLQSLVL